MFNQKEYMKIYMRQYRINNPEKVKRSNKKYSENNKDKILKWSRQWHKDNPEYNKQYYKRYHKIVREKYNLWRKKRYLENSKYNLNYKISVLMRRCLKSGKDGRHWEDLVGYTLDDLMKRLKKTIPEGYNWNDFLEGKLHIDHIIPIRAFIFQIPKDEEFENCWSLDNLRLLTKEENLLKNRNFDNPILLGLLIK